MNQYLDLFLEEAMEHLQNLNQHLLNLESNPDRLELLDEIFRAAHTLKGMAATMGFNTITHLTHQLENVLGKLRERKLVLDPSMLNCFFQAVDAIEGMVSCIREGQDPQAAPEHIIAILTALENGTAVPVNQTVLGSSQKVRCRQAAGEGENNSSDMSNVTEYNDYEQGVIKEAYKKGIGAWQIKITIESSCVMKGVRAFMVFRNLETIGEIIKSAPSVQEIEDEKFADSFLLVLLSAEKAEIIKEQLDSISEITYEIIEVLPDSLENNKTHKDGEAEYVPNLLVQEETKQEGELSSREAENTKGDGAQEKKQRSHQTVRVDIHRLDKLMSLVGELVINKTRLEQINLTKNTGGLSETIEQINRITTDLQSVVQNVRMVSIEQVFNRFPRMVRDLAQNLGKEVNLILEGKETELDRTVIDEIGDPLVHLIRNAIDHGLELPAERVAAQKKAEGTLRLSAKQEGNHVLITVEDDGKGIKAENIKKRSLEKGLLTEAKAQEMDEQALLNLIFTPGFSTANTITDISGRGVGLDVVLTKIQSLSGHVSLESKPGQGSTFNIKLPLTLAIIQALLVDVQGETYAVPLANIDETTILEMSQVKNIQDQQVMVLRGNVLPLFFLKHVLEVECQRETVENYVVVVRKGDQRIGLVADELIGQQEIVINSMGKYLSGLPGLAGASILGDGRVSLILDIGTLI